MSGPVVAVFGSARLAAGDAEYDQARALGRLIGEAGWTVATGGYTGVMEAACRGAIDYVSACLVATEPSRDGLPVPLRIESPR